MTRLRAALTDAGWDLADAPTRNVVATEKRTLTDWGLYRVEVYLEAAPIGDTHVRLFVHPQRRYFTGGRSKIPFLGRSLRRSILPDLNEAFEKQGLTLALSPRERGLVDNN